MPARILHIDDDPDILFSVKCILEREGYEVDTAASIEVGMDQMERQPPDLIILDVMIDEFDSGLTSYVDLHRKNRDIPIIFLTSLGDQIRPYFASFASSGEMVWILEKPVDPEKIRAAVQSRLKT